MAARARTWITTLALGLAVGGCLPCVPGVRVDAPRTAACLADAAGCHELPGAVENDSPSGGMAARAAR
jgi:hypothetical protein